MHRAILNKQDKILCPFCGLDCCRLQGITPSQGPAVTLSFACQVCEGVFTLYIITDQDDSLWFTTASYHDERFGHLDN